MTAIRTFGVCPWLRAMLTLASVLVAAQAWATDPLDGITIEPEHNVSYDRDRDYGGWTKPEPCMNTRMVVLRDESAPSKYKITKRANGVCDVWIGRWKEPYVGYTTTDPRKLDIDHLVPLREAHQSGAYAWTKTKRKQYANYLVDPWHLIAVDASANRQKGDQDPATWLPPKASFRCTYLEHWVEVKRHWHLSMDQAEADAVRGGLAAC